MIVSNDAKEGGSFGPCRGGMSTKASCARDFRIFPTACGQSCWQSVDSVLKTLPKSRGETQEAQTRPRVGNEGPHGRYPWCKWESCLQAGKFWKEPAWLRDPDRRPPVPRDPLPAAILEHWRHTGSQQICVFPGEGQQLGLFGMTTDHLRVVLDQVRDTHLLYQMMVISSFERAHPQWFTTSFVSGG